MTIAPCRVCPQVPYIEEPEEDNGEDLVPPNAAAVAPPPAGPPGLHLAALMGNL